MSVTSLLEELIACPSLTPNDAGCQAIIKNRLNKLGFDCETFAFNEVTNLWAKRGNSGPLFVFAGHTDVVPTGPLSEWQSYPFKAEIRDGYLFGRGACDMKASLAAMVIATEKFVHDYPRMNGAIGFLLTSDEEGPALDGTAKVIDALYERGEKIDYCIVGEPSSDQQTGDQIRIGRRGSLHGTLVVKGKQGHVAHPHLALNPIHQSMRALHELSEQAWDQGNDYFPATTFQISNIHSGTGALNVIPGSLEVNFNFRYGTAVTVSELKERTMVILQQFDLQFNIEWQLGAEPFLTRSGKLIDYTKQVIAKEAGLTVKLSTGGGTSDGRFIAPRGVELLELGTPHASAHQVNEFVRVADLEMLVILYYEILQKLLVY